MAAKQYFSKKKKKEKGKWLVAAVLGVFLFITLGNVQTAFKSINKRQLISLQSDNFPSSEYQAIQLGSTKKIAQQNFSEIDRFARELNYSGSSIPELATLLAKNATTDTEKARIIYAWITQHVTYDIAAFREAVDNDNYPDVDAEKVLRDRTTICSGYSNLYQALAEAMNLKSVIVVGYGKGATPKDEKFQDVNHAWNAVKLEAGWYLLDATWGAGSVRDNQFEADYKPYYFATAPDELINNHFPQDQGWQLLAQTYTRTEFDNLPDIASRFYSLGLNLVTHRNYQISASGRIDINLKAPADIIAVANLKQGTQESPQSAVLVNRQASNLIISVAPPMLGTYELTIYAKKKDDPEKYSEIINYQINALNSAAGLPKIYDHFNQYQASLVEPLTAELKPNWSTYFNLVVPQAIDVQVVNAQTKQWTPLNGYGNYFAGHVDIQSGNTAIVAKFPGDDRYWQLVEYQSR
ncbi:transglutaminase domain-containing protein [Pleurocapsa sp. FMAR1]|uniref:transglutaminase domain-containing protein n=1 Tax=Pleurocapsa sp. FMAR1 TaxID=3040204 RepID=UPI0029C7514B|nr:transglutaminase domain-containing protein [Pleurocapsa sp. FMAR1]